MTDLRTLFGTSKQLETEGVWHNIGGKNQIKVARLNNPKFRALYKRLTKPYERQLRQGTLSDEKETEILCKCLAETILLDWELTLDKKPLPYSKENALKLLSDETLSDFRDAVVDCAKDAEQYREDSLEEAEKNLKRGSAGKSSGENTSNS